jgi:hypothetical protein
MSARSTAARRWIGGCALSQQRVITRGIFPGFEGSGTFILPQDEGSIPESTFYFPGIPGF